MITTFREIELKLQRIFCRLRKLEQNTGGNTGSGSGSLVFPDFPATTILYSGALANGQVFDSAAFTEDGFIGVMSSNFNIIL
jgi:hypothetical protein